MEHPTMGYACCLIAGIGFAVNYLPVKSCDIGDGIFFSAAMSVGILLVGVATGLFLTSTPTMEIPSFEPLAAAGGAMWMMGNLMCPYIIKLIGLGLGLTVWDLSNMLTGWFTGYFGLFGMQKEKNVEIPAMNFAGLILASLSLVFFSLASAYDCEAKEKGDLESGRDRSESNHDQDPSNSNAEAVRSNDVKKSSSKGVFFVPTTKISFAPSLSVWLIRILIHFLRKLLLFQVVKYTPSERTGRWSSMLGFGMAIVAGLLFGSTFDLPMDLMDGDFGSRRIPKNLEFEP